MSERIIIAGEPVVVPPEVVTDGRLAVQAWHKEQLTEHGIAFTVAENGDPIMQHTERRGRDASPLVPDTLTQE